MNKRTKIIVEVNRCAENFYDKSLEIGTLAAQAFSEDVKQERHRNSSSHEKEDRALQKHRAQMTSLENIAETTLKVTDVLDFIKKQIARQANWRKEYQGKQFGESLKQFIEDDIKRVVEVISAEVHIGNGTNADKLDRQYIYLLLVRQFIRQIVVQYEYHVSQIAEELQQNDQRTRTSTNTAPQR